MAVIVVVDQMRADYLDRYSDDYKYGLKKLRTEGQVFTQAFLNHVPTETAPGHAAISTGRPPGYTGIVGNDWLDQDKGVKIESVYDPEFKIGPAQLKARTLGDQMKDQNPNAKVVALSFKDRSAIMLGGKRADTVVWFDKKKNGFTSSAAYGIEPAWIAAFNGANITKKWVLPSVDTDKLTLDLVKRTFKEIPLGQDSDCDLLAISFSGTDYIGHVHGPDSPQIKAQLLSLDKILGSLLELLSEKAPGNFVVALTSDHGVLPIPEGPEGRQMKAKRIFVGTLARQLEDACQKAFPLPDQKWVLDVNMPTVSLNKALVESRHMDWGDFVIKVANEWKKIPDVAMVYFNNPFIFQDEWNEDYQRSYYVGRSGSLSLRMQPGVLVTERLTGTSHGTIYEYDTHVPLLFYGPGFPAEQSAKRVSIETLAPTLAANLGIPFE